MLNNTVRKLKTDKKLNVVYLGGSVTNGFGSSNAAELSWRALSGKHLQEQFPDAEINLFNAGVGGTGTGFARFRLKTDVLDKNPDLVFIEFSINDAYESYSPETSKLYYESLIHTINKSNPYIDIVIVIITDRGNMRNGHTSIVNTHFDIARYYNLPVINIVDAVAEDMKINNRDEDYYLTDWAHPNDAGYAFYATVANKFIDENIVNASFGEIAAHSLPSAESEALILGDTTALFPNELEPTANNGFKIEEPAENSFILKSENAGDSIEFDFIGTHFSAWVSLGGENRVEGGADAVECWVDGELLNTISVKSWSSSTVHRPIVHGLENKKHHIVLLNKNGGILVIRKLFLA